MSDTFQSLSEIRASSNQRPRNIGFEKSKTPGRSAKDPRAERTRAALADAFSRLLLSQGYDALTPASIAAAAGVARSTFYAHYGGKPALLRHVLQRVLQPLADTVSAVQSGHSLEPVLDHFWVNRRLARVVMTGRPRLILQDRLAELIELNLRRERIVLQVSLPMAAACVARRCSVSRANSNARIWLVNCCCRSSTAAAVAACAGSATTGGSPMGSTTGVGAVTVVPRRSAILRRISSWIRWVRSAIAES